MCTLACWIGVFPEAPLVVAANRDERLGRPARAPFVWPGAPRIVAPLDEQAGGTWWALNEHGLFVALTNRAGAMLNAGRRSRGLLVLEVARSRSLAEAETWLSRLAADEYNGFHLLASDGSAGVRAVNTGTTLDVARLAPGFHVVTERSFGASPTARDERVLELLGTASTLPLDVPGLERVLATHDADPFDSLCVHADAIEYGTRSSTVLALGPAIGLLHFAPQAPCRSTYVDMSGVLQELGRSRA